MQKKVLIAMSGGVDSGVAAYLMKKQGYDCVGATMKLYRQPNTASTPSCCTEDDIADTPSCCTEDDIADARAVAKRLGMPHHVFNFSDSFREKVIDNFVRCYECGRTPNPCVECNRYLKFEYLHDKAASLGCDYVVTGHYARICRDEASGRFLLKKAPDLSKDQSYVLYSLTQKQLAHTLFPLGNMTKAETRRIAEAQGFLNAKKHDSQDICFVPDGDYAAFIEAYTNRKYPEGDFIDKDGNVLGRHKGIIRYTVGQRRGLGLSLKEPMYVMAVNTEDNTVMLGRDSDLFSAELYANRVNLISVSSVKQPMRVKAKVRYRHTEQWATVTQENADTLHVVFDEPQRAITLGQSVVLYDGDTVVGGGTICRTQTT